MKLSRYYSILFLLLIAAYSAEPARAQSRQTSNPNDAISADKAYPSSSPSILASPEAEMIARSRMKYEEKEYKENLERAREAAQLGSELHEAYKKNSSLSQTDIKKLDRLEKITRRIRSAAGGSDDEEQIEDAPSKLETALVRLAETSEGLQKGVEKTPRLVISSLVIGKANELLEIIKYIRDLSR